MNRTTRTLSIAAAGLLSLVALTACGSSSGESPASTSSSAPAMSSAAGGDSSMSSMIMIKDFGFSVPGNVRPGAKVMVMNEDSEAHTVTSDKSGLFDVKVDAGKTVMLTVPDKAGSYAFHCTYHSQMHGTLKVG
jgi:plastocyanin